MPTPTSCGILERPHTAEMMTWIEEVFGEGPKITILAETARPRTACSTTASSLRRSVSLRLNWWTSSAAPAISKSGRASSRTSTTSQVLYLGSYAALQTDGGDPVQTLDALTWTLENSPVRSGQVSGKRRCIGTLGGPIISGYTQGFVEAEKLLKSS
ncbi:MAG: hypothetical protein IPK19_42135 [Chloroflexi bacterium]|nr:hypothetical protein [Chloroflexota bacterium]